MTAYLHCVVVGVGWALPVLIRRTDVVDETSIGDITVELKRRLSMGPDGSGRIALLEQRERLFHRLLRPPWFVLGLVAFFVLLYWLVETQSDLNPFIKRTRFGATIPALVASGEVYRIVTAGFLHLNLTHLVANSIELIIFGWIVEAAIGARRVALLLFCTSVLGYCAFFISLVSDVRLNLSGGVGSSAAVWGIGGAAAVLMSLRRKDFPVGFRGPVLIGLWIDIAYQVYGTSSSIASVPHLAGAFSGVLIAAWLTWNNRGIPLLGSSSLTPMICLVSLVVLISAGAAVHNQCLYGESRYLAMVHERLAGPTVPDEKIDGDAWVFAVADAVPEESLRLALRLMKDLVDRDPNPAYRDTLATLYYRLGDFRRSVQIMQGVWRDNPTPWSATQLARFYEAELRGRSTESAGWDEKFTSLPRQVNVQLALSEFYTKLDFRVLPIDSVAVPAIVHALVYEGGELRGLVDISMASKPIDIVCRIGAEALQRHRLEALTLRPVWYHRADLSLTSLANTCRLQWLIPGAKYVP